MENAAEPAADPSPSWGRLLREVLETVLLALVLALVIRAFLFESFVVQGNSMEPALRDGERLLVNKVVYQLREPRVGDIIVFEYPQDPARDFIKRIVAVGGDRVEVRNGTVYLNGQGLDEPYVQHHDFSDFGPLEIPEDRLFVLGDNRTNSRDSRSFGHVGMEAVKGEALFVFWPVDRLRLLRPAVPDP